MAPPDRSVFGYSYIIFCYLPFSPILSQNCKYLCKMFLNVCKSINNSTIQAEEKGATVSIYGFIIGTNCLTSFLVTPFIGKNVKDK